MYCWFPCIIPINCLSIKKRSVTWRKQPKWTRTSLLLNIFVGVRLVYASPQTETSVKSQRLIVETFGTWNFIEQGCRNPVLKTCYPAESSILQTGGNGFHQGNWMGCVCRPRDCRSRPAFLDASLCSQL